MNFPTSCRVCIRSENSEMISIFDSYNFAERYCEIFKVIIDCASVQIQKIDGFPQKICRKCLELLSQAYFFKKLCENSDYKFRNNLIVTNEIAIKSELPDEDACFDVHNENSDAKSNEMSYGLIEVKEEFLEEDTVINYGDTHSDQITDIKMDSEGSELIAVKTEKPDYETKTENKIDGTQHREEELHAVKCEKPSSSKKTEIPSNCTFCGRNLTSSNLTSHIKLHKEENLINCDFCKKNFRQSGNLGPDVLFHLEEKRYQCDICGKQFTESGSLTAHTRLHTGEKRFKCCICDKKFTQSGHLVTHFRLHTGEQRFNCGFCDKKFTNSSNLAVHVRLHTGEKRYKCEFCDKKFRQSSHLASHVAVHTGDKRYECDICGKKYAQSGSLVSHKKGHMKNNFYNS